jgi:hypothetical protein
MHAVSRIIQRLGLRLKRLGKQLIQRDIGVGKHLAKVYAELMTKEN